MYNLFLLIISLLVLSSSNLQGQSKPEREGALKNKRNMLQDNSDSLFTININNIFVTIDAKVGARIISLKIGGRELLSSKKVNPHFFGSTLWLAPEGKKGQGVLDNGDYKVVYFHGTDLTLESKRDTLRGFLFSKQFHGDITDTSITINYIIANISKDTQEVAPWEVTRVPTGGLAFTPKANQADIPKPNQSYPLLKIIDSLGIIWYPYDSSEQSPQKMFMNGGEGWIAYVNNDMLFIKKFPVIKPNQAAPGEKNVEMYVNKEKTYIELENQGVYERLLPHNSLIYKVKWYARKLSDVIKIEPGDIDILKYVRSIIK